MKRILALLAVLLWSGPVQALDWKDCESGDAKGSIQIGRDLCIDHVDSDLDSVLLGVGRCPLFDVIFNSDDTGTGLTTTIQVWTCVTPNANVNACNPIEDLTLTGAAGVGEIYGASAKWIFVKGTNDPGAETPRTMIRCTY